MIKITSEDINDNRKTKSVFKKNGEPIFQIGKEGVTDAFIDGLNKALTKREILKVHILETAMLDTRDTCNYVAERLGAEPVQAIGNKFIIYRKSDEEKYRKIELPRK